MTGNVCVRARLTGVRPAVRLQVGALGVHLVAAGEVAAVDAPLLQRVGRFCGQRVVRARVHDHRRVVAPGTQNAGQRV